MESDAVNHKIDNAVKTSGGDLLSENNSKLTENLHSHSSNPSQSFLEAEISRNQDPIKPIFEGGDSRGKENVSAQALGYSPSELVTHDDGGDQNDETAYKDAKSDSSPHRTVYEDANSDPTPDRTVKQEPKEEVNNTKELDVKTEVNDPKELDVKTEVNDPKEQGERTPASENKHPGEHTGELKIENNEGSSIKNEQSESMMHTEKSTETQINEQTENNESKPQTDEEQEEEWLDILGSGQLKKKVLRKAENSYRPQRPFICEINVEGQLEDGTIVDRAEKLTVQIGDAEVVQGLDLALPLMDVGELALVQVGPRFAYGSLGNPPDIPSSATIIYTVELLSAEPEPEIETLSVSKRKEIGCRKRERGNWWYARQEHTLAIQCYRRALEYLDDVEGGIVLDPKSETEEESEKLQDLLEERLKVYNNLAAAQLKIKAYDTALQSVGHVLRCQPNNVKALFRKAKILAAKGENAAAVENLRQASKLEPESRMIKQELMRILSLHKQDTKHERNLYKKMLGQDKPAEPTRNSKFHIPWGILCGTVAAMVAGAVAIRYRFI